MQYIFVYIVSLPHDDHQLEVTVLTWAESRPLFLRGAHTLACYLPWRFCQWYVPVGPAEPCASELKSKQSMMGGGGEVGVPVCLVIVPIEQRLSRRARFLCCHGNKGFPLPISLCASLHLRCLSLSLAKHWFNTCPSANGSQISRLNILRFISVQWAAEHYSVLSVLLTSTKNLYNILAL